MLLFLLSHKRSGFNTRKETVFQSLFSNCRELLVAANFLYGLAFIFFKDDEVPDDIEKVLFMEKTGNQDFLLGGTCGQVFFPDQTQRKHFPDRGMFCHVGDFFVILLLPFMEEIFLGKYGPIFRTNRFRAMTA